MKTYKSSRMPIQSKLIEYTAGRHPVYDMVEKYGWKKFSQMLEDQVSRKRVLVKTEGNLKIYNYSGIMQLSKNKWCETTMVCRGLICDDTHIIATGFPKFFNYSEVKPYVDTQISSGSKFTAYDKIDGSLGIMFFNPEESKWRISTRGAFSSKSCQAKWAENYLKTIDTSKFVKGSTYLLEIVCPESKIIVNYDWEGFCLLGGYDSSGYELSQKEMMDLPIKMVKQFDFKTVGQVVEMAKKIPATMEGWVIRFDNGVRFKIKGDEYKKCHKARSNITPKKAKDVVVNGVDLDKYLAELPNEFNKQFQEMIDDFNKTVDDLIEKIVGTLTEANGMSGKELSTFFRMKFGKKHPKWCGLCFKLTKDDFDNRLDRDFIRKNYLSQLGKIA